MKIELVSLKLGPSYSTTTSSLIVIFCGESGIDRPFPLAEMIERVSSPDTKYDMASDKSASVRIENSSPSSSV